MATAVLDLDLDRLPETVGGLERYREAFVLVRLGGCPVGRAYLPVEAGRLAVDDLRQALVAAAGLPYWERQLQRFLEEGSDHAEPAPQATATIAVCTRDHPEDLQRCLDALMRLPDDGQEILVVDSCPSTGATRELVSRYARARYTLEPRPGLNVARNRALREARHDVVAFTDDDAAPDAEWLQAVMRAFDDPSVVCVTGLVMPLELETRAQEWFEHNISHSRGFWRAEYDGASLPPLQADELGVGANMALRRNMLEGIGPFDEALDAGTPTGSGGDTDMFARILASGGRLAYEPAAVVWHRHRPSWRQLRRLMFNYGVGHTAFLARWLVVERKDTAVDEYIYAFQRHYAPGVVRALLRRDGARPADLAWAELAGALWGPWAYLQSRYRSAGGASAVKRAGPGGLRNGLSKLTRAVSSLLHRVGAGGRVSSATPAELPSEPARLQWVELDLSGGLAAAENRLAEIDGPVYVSWDGQGLGFIPGQSGLERLSSGKLRGILGNELARPLLKHMAGADGPFSVRRLLAADEAQAIRQTWNQRLLRCKLWLDESRQIWQRQAAAHEQTLAAQKELIGQLEQEKADLERQHLALRQKHDALVANTSAVLPTARDGAAAGRREP